MPIIAGFLIGCLTMALSFFAALDSERVYDNPSCVNYFKTINSLWWTDKGSVQIYRSDCSDDPEVREQKLQLWKEKY